MYNALVICGPTAVGKTRLAIQLALALNGEIISADSRQVYRGCDIGTGKDLAEYDTPQGRVPVHLVDVADPVAQYSLFMYQQDFSRVCAAVRQRRCLPIICGGTGLYIEAVCRGYNVPPVPEDVPFRQEMMARSHRELQVLLHTLAPQLYTRTDTSSKKRIVRALEIARYAPAQSLPAARDETHAIEALVIGIYRKREELHARIATRLQARFEEGMLAEVRGLLHAGVAPARLEQMGMEYRLITQHLQGETTFGEMRDTLEREIRRLAKRQMTWFRGMVRRGTAVHWIEGPDKDAALALCRRHGLAPAD